MGEKALSVTVQPGFRKFMRVSAENGCAFLLLRDLSSELQSGIAKVSRSRAVKEEMQGTMIVPSDPSGRLSPVAAGVVVPVSGRAVVFDRNPSVF